MYMYLDILHMTPRSDQACYIIRCKNLALHIRDCLARCISEDTQIAVGPFYNYGVYDGGSKRNPTQGVNV